MLLAMGLRTTRRTTKDMLWAFFVKWCTTKSTVNNRIRWHTSEMRYKNLRYGEMRLHSKNALRNALITQKTILKFQKKIFKNNSQGVFLQNFSHSFFYF